MKLATTTADFTHYFDNDTDRLRAVAAAGFRYVDLSMYPGSASGWEYAAEDWERKAYALGEEAARLGVTFVQAHAPGYTSLLGAEGRERLLADTERSFKICAVLGIRNNVVHTGWSPEILYDRPGDKEKYFAVNRGVLRTLYPTLEKTGVNLLIENTCKKNFGGMWFFLTGSEMKEFIAYCAHPLIHAVWDVGHAAIEGHQYRDIVDLGDDLRALHIHDNRGADHHELPLTGMTNYDEILSALIEIGYKGCFTMEADNVYYGFRYLRAHPEAQKYGSRFAVPPLKLKEMSEKLLWETGKYILDTYGLYEE